MTRGQIGGEDVPKWYIELLAADRLHISVVELQKLPIIWRERALTALAAENEARDALEQRARDMRANQH